MNVMYNPLETMSYFKEVKVVKGWGERDGGND